MGDFLYVTSKQYEKRRKSSNGVISDLGVWHKFWDLFCFLPPTYLSAEANLQWIKFFISLPHSLGILLAYQLVCHFCYFPPKICFLDCVYLRAFYKLVCILKNKPIGQPDKMQIVYLCGVIPLIPW